MYLSSCGTTITNDGIEDDCIVVTALRLGLNRWDYHTSVLAIINFANGVALVSDLRFCTIEQESWRT